MRFLWTRVVVDTLWIEQVSADWELLVPTGAFADDWMMARRACEARLVEEGTGVATRLRRLRTPSDRGAGFRRRGFRRRAS